MLNTGLLRDQGRVTIIDILHHLVGLLCFFLAGKEDAHRRDGFILLEGIDEKTLALRLEGMNEMDINQTIAMSHKGRRNLQRMTPEIINSRHIRQKANSTCSLRAHASQFYPVMVSQVKQILAKNRGSISLSSAKIRMARAIVEAF